LPAALVAAETHGVATLSANLARSIKDRLQLATFQPPVKMPPIAVTQYWHARYHQDPGHRWLRQTCFGLLGGSA
jgi:DNA-binding transcriptional LysR family regulator